MANTRSKTPAGKKRKTPTAESSGSTNLTNLVSNLGDLSKEIEQAWVEIQAATDDKIDKAELEKMEKELATSKKETAGKQKEIAALKKEVANLKKKVKRSEERLAEEKRAFEEERKEVIEGCKVSTKLVLAKARLQMLKEMKDPEFDQSKWDVAQWEAFVKANGSISGPPKDHSQDQHKKEEELEPEDAAMGGEADEEEGQKKDEEGDKKEDGGESSKP